MTDSELEPKDSAHDLHKLIDKIITAQEHASSDGNKLKVHPLSKTFDKIALVIGFEDYGIFLKEFFRLCDRVEGDIVAIDLRRSQLREKYERTLREIRAVLSAENFEKKTRDVFAYHFSIERREVLLEISDRLEQSGGRSADLSELEGAFDAVIDMVDFLENAEVVEGRMRRIIRLHIDHLKSVIATYETLGERDFWAHYKILFATFFQVMNRVDESSAAEFQSKFQSVMKHMLLGSSLAANAITIGGPMLKLIGVS